jgi:hypothetical protein
MATQKQLAALKKARSAKAADVKSTKETQEKRKTAPGAGVEIRENGAVSRFGDIPTGRTKEDIKAREKVIKNFYSQWIAEHTDKKIFNKNLNDYIHIRFLSIDETVEKAARSYNSTLAVLQLTDILKYAKVTGVSIPKQNKNQKRFIKMLIMQYNTAKMIVGVLNSDNKKIQYCITSIEKD